MTTFLAQQLKKLAVPQTTLLLQDKTKPSLLFDPKEAATLDRDTVFAIGYTGLEELEQINPRFSDFEATLFNEASKHFERSVQDTETNAKLDATIKNFLSCASPYLLLKPAQKTLEWLIHRFHIHMFNIEDLLSCIFPYHETRIFVRVLQLIDLSSPASEWHWLEPLQKPGVPLPKSVLFTHCFSELSFMRFICELVPNSLKVSLSSPSSSKMAISFYAVTIVGALHQCKRPSEEIVALLLPYILKGLKSDDIDYRTSSYMIICQITKLTPDLSPDLLEKLCNRILKRLKEESGSEGLMCLLAIFRYQKIKKISESLLTDICKHKMIVQEAQLLSESYELWPFFKPLLRRLLPKILVGQKAANGKPSSEFKFLFKILKNVRLDEKTVSKAVRNVLKNYNNTIQASNNTVKENAKEILNHLESRYPTAVDKAVGDFLSSASDSAQRKVQKLLFLVSSSKTSLLGKNSDLLYLTISHPNESRRVSGLKSLIQLRKQGKIKSISFVKDCIIPRLNDDSPSVVTTALSLKQDLFELTSTEEMFAILSNLLEVNRANKTEWFDVKKEILELICNYEYKDDTLEMRLLLVLLPFFLPVDSEDFDLLSQCVFKSRFARTHFYLCFVIEALKDFDFQTADIESEHQMFAFNEKSLKALVNSTQMITFDQRKTMLEAILRFNGNRKNVAVSSFIGLGILNKLIETSSSVDEQIKYGQQCLDHCKQAFGHREFDQNVAETLKISGRVPFFAVFTSLECITRLKIPNQHLTPEAQKLRVELFHFLSSNLASKKPDSEDLFQDLLKGFFNSTFDGSLENQLKFLSNLWVEHLKAPADRISNCPQIQQISLSVATLLISKAEDMNWFYEKNNTISFMLLSCLTSGEQVIRLECLKCMSTIIQGLPEDCNYPFKRLFAHLTYYKEESLVNKEYYPTLLSSWLNPALSLNLSEFSGRSTRTKTAMSNITDEHYVLSEILRILNSSDVPDYGKLGILVALRECNSFEILSELSSLLVTILDENEPVGKTLKLQGDILSEIFKKYTVLTATMLTAVHIPVFKVFERSLKSTLSVLDGKQQTVQHMAAKIISKKFFNAIPNEAVKQVLIRNLLDAYIDNSNGSNNENIIWKSLKKVCCDAKFIARELRIKVTSTDVNTMKEARLTRLTHKTKESPKAEIATLAPFEWHSDWKKISAVLEVIQGRRSIDNVELLLVPLFDLLKRSLEFEGDPQLEYLRQLILSALYNCCTLIKNSGITIPEQSFQIELAVQCIRISTNPQTHHHALLVLNLAATMYPDYVLHNIMAIFTFMGANLVRQDDSYSFQMIIKTVDTIIPALMQASQCQSEPDAKTPIIVAAVTQVFVDAFKDIPQHRQLPLFHKLISTLGPSKYLSFPLLQMFGNVVTAPQDTSAKERGSSPKIIEFAIEMCHSLNPALQVAACNKIIIFLAQLPSNKGSDSPKDVDKEFLLISSALFDTRLRTEKELRHFKYTAVSFVASLLSSKEFISQVIDLQPEQVQKLQILYRNLLEATMQYLLQVANQVQRNANTPTFKFWKTLQHKLYDLLEKVNSLLPNDQFINVIQGLLNHPRPLVCRKAMEMLNSKLVHQSSSTFAIKDLNLILDLIQPLMKQAKGSKRSDVEHEREESVVNQQVALMSLQLICKLMGSSHPSRFNKVLQTVIKVLHRARNHPQLLSSALLCLAGHCQSLKAHCLPYLNQFMPLLIKLVEDIETLESNDLLLLSVVTTVQRLVEHLSGFLGLYLQTLMTQICRLSSSHPDDENSSKGSLQYRLRCIKSQIAIQVPARVLIPVLTKSYEELLHSQDCHTALGPLMSVLREGISIMENNILSSFLGDLQNFFLSALNFRRTQNKISLPMIDFVEEHVINAMITFILKLSETNFRPIFYRVFEWATLDEEQSKERTLTFYRLTSFLAEKLKSLFVLFASHFVKSAADVLDANNEAKDGSYFGNSKKSKDKSCLLLKHLLQTLHICFLHDNKCLVDQQCFETLMQPLVDQIENQVGTEEQYQERITEYLSPCLAQFAVAAADDTSWKPFNYQILLKTRHSSPKVRFAALEVLQNLVQKLGDDYMVLLPESIPFLAELMEDESFEVEQQCQTVVAKMEQILGEPLMKYF